MAPPLFIRTAVVAGLVALAGSTFAQQPGFAVVNVAERTLDKLPPGPLYWRIETFTSRANADKAAEASSLMVDVNGSYWLFTLAGKSGKGRGTLVDTIGPVPAIEAPKYLLRINRAGGPPGVQTPVHTHPGSEAFHVLTGRLCQRTEHGTVTLDAGESMNGHEPGMVMQLTSCGAETLDQLVMFVVDATKPFSPIASFNEDREQKEPPRR